MELEQTLDLKTDTLYDKAVLFVATALFIATITFTTIQVLVRQVGFGSEYFFWTESAARIILIFMTFLGAAVASRNYEHISIELLLEKIQMRHPVVRIVLDLFVAIVVILVLTIFLRGTTARTLSDWGTSFGGGIAGLTLGMVFLGMSVGIAAMLIYELQKLVYNGRVLLANVRDEPLINGRDEVN